MNIRVAIPKDEYLPACLVQSRKSKYVFGLFVVGQIKHVVPYNEATRIIEPKSLCQIKKEEPWESDLGRSFEGVICLRCIRVFQRISK